MYPEGGWSCIRNGGMRKTTPWTLDQDLMMLKPKIDTNNPNWASLVLFVQHTIIICFYSYCPNLVKNWNSLWLRRPMTTDWLLWPESFFGMWSDDQPSMPPSIRPHSCHRSNCVYGAYPTNNCGTRRIVANISPTTNVKERIRANLFL